MTPEEVTELVERLPPVTDEEMAKTTNELKRRLQQCFNYTLPVLWAETPEQFTSLRRRLYQISRIKKYYRPKPFAYSKLEAQLNDTLRKGDIPRTRELNRLVRLGSPLLTGDLPKEDAQRLRRQVGVDAILGNESSRYFIWDPSNRLKDPIFQSALALLLTKYCVVALARPAHVRFNATWRFHNEDGPAFVSAKGHKMYALFGIRLGEPLITMLEAPAKLTKYDIIGIFSTPNVDIRTVAVRKIGFERLLRALGMRKLDVRHGYTLYKPDGGLLHANCLEMINPTTSARHFEWVPDWCSTVQEALRFRNRHSGLPVICT